MTNFGAARRLTVDGVPVGPAAAAGDPYGSRPERRPARASASSSPTRRWTAPRARGSPAGSGSAWPAPGRSPTTAAARSSWRSATGLRADRDGKPDGHAADHRAGAGPVLRGRRRGGRGGRAELDVHRPHRVRARREHQRDRRTPSGVLDLVSTSSTDGHEGAGGPHPGPRRLVAGSDPLPAGRRRGPQPCLVEALPYRKDDLTSSYADGYSSLCEKYGYAVARIDVRGTGSSPGDADDEYPEAEQRDLPTRSPGWPPRTGATGRSGCGARRTPASTRSDRVERPPELKAICAIFATDDRWTDDVHWRGGALRLVDLVDYDHYMTADVRACRPVPAVWGDGLAGGVAAADRDQEPWMLTWLRENRHGPYWDHGSVRHRRDDVGLRAHRLPGDDRGRLGRRLPQQLVPHRRELARHGVPHRLLAGPWAHADPLTAMPGPRIDFDVELGRVVRPLAARHRRARGPVRRVRARVHQSRDRPRPARGRWVTLPSVPPVNEATLDLPRR